MTTIEIIVFNINTAVGHKNLKKIGKVKSFSSYTSNVIALEAAARNCSVTDPGEIYRKF